MLIGRARGFRLAHGAVSGPVVELPDVAAVAPPAAAPKAVEAAPGSVWFHVAKRAFDIAGALFGLVVCAPLIIAIVLLVRVGTNGPAFYSQLRVGRRGRCFRCWKFRTMVLDADLELVRLLDRLPALRDEYSKSRKLQTDPRITPIGRWLRRTSLDELPQLWNVLRGDMTLVGPRPLLVDEPERYGQALATVLRVRPGLTGIWQVSGRNAVPYSARVEMQARQAEQTALLRDFAIVLRTLAQMMRWRSSGAC